MKLSELVAYHNRLNEFNLNDATIKTTTDIHKIKHQILTSAFKSEELENQLTVVENEITQKFNDFTNLIQQLKQSVQLEINKREQELLVDSDKLYREGMAHDSDEYILNRRPTLNDDDTLFIKSRISMLSDNRYPAMIIRPGLEHFIDNMVSFNPLYVVDKSEEIMFPATIEFPELFRNRLRFCVVDEYTDTDVILTKVPDNQISMCLAYNFFEFKPLEIIERYLTEIFSKLRPGGKLLMTFNDCDNEKAVRLAESFYACYTPGRLVKTAAEKIGFELYFQWNNDMPSTWLELKKPGELKTLRANQPLARIVHIHK